MIEGRDVYANVDQSTLDEMAHEREVVDLTVRDHGRFPDTQVWLK